MPQTLEAIRADTSFFGHPRGLATLFFTEMWERFSYYGMRALLILFMTASVSKGGLGFPVVKAGAIYGFYTAMVYLLSLPGGWVADRIFGQRRAVLYGGILIVIGQFFLMSPGVQGFYAGLGLLMLGTGMLKPNVSTIVGQLYGPGDRRRDSGFSIFYMGINLGGLLAPLACGYVGERVGWRLGFGLAGVGMIAGLIQYVLGAKYLGTAGLHPSPPESPEAGRRLKKNAALVVAGAVAILGAVGLLAATGALEITAQRVSATLGLVLIIVSVAIFAWLLLGRGWSTEERKRSAAILVLFVASATFWAAYEQAGSSLSLFAERSTNRVVMGFDFPASWFQFVPSAFVMILAPIFAWLWIALGKREPSSPAKFAWALAVGALAFAILVPPARATLTGRAGVAVVADRHVFSADCRRDVPESGGTERDVEAGAGARSGTDDGPVVCLDQHRRLSGGDGGVGLRIDAAAVVIRDRGADFVRRGGGVGAAGEADEEADERRQLARDVYRALRS